MAFAGWIRGFPPFAVRSVFPVRRHGAKLIRFSHAGKTGAVFRLFLWITRWTGLCITVWKTRREGFVSGACRFFRRSIVCLHGLALPVSVPAKPLRPRDAGCRFVPPAGPASGFGGAHAMRCFAHYLKITWQYLVFQRFFFSHAGLPISFFQRSLNGSLADWRDVWCRFCICQ